MRAAGVIVEYNPMHNGHCYHIQQTKKVTGADAIVAVMSGHFLQRGEPAIVNKWARTEMALQNGVDLVLELPIFYSIQSARLFAFGAVATLDRCGVVDSICFGSEKGDLRSLQQLAALIADPPPALQSILQTKIKQGLAYPAAYAASLREYAATTGTLDPEIVDHPNNMLGIEYLHALQKLNSSIRPFTIGRMAAHYHDATFSDRSIASATAIRRAIADGQPIDSYLPAVNLEIMRGEFAAGRGPVDWDSFTQPIFALLARSTVRELETYLHVDQGLAVRMLESLPYASRTSELLYRVKTRSYTWTRIQRALTSLLLGIRKQTADSLHLENGPDSIRVLGFTETGRHLLKEAASVSTLPIFTSIAKEVPPMVEMNLRASDLYGLAYVNRTPENRRREAEVPVVRLGS